ncbi:hypothetical protein [Halostagnicola larsenii]|uniref:hypothetical protein n=1 Tax=Halostagnicola larsenii TaxID=353800 RepID=UPI0012FB439D|nr:hypothetical protein [Halostagnicola larsenii]
MEDSDAPGNSTSVGLQQLAKLADNSNEQSIEFWDSTLENSRLSFQNSIESVRSTRKRCVELIKLDVLLASFYVALFQLGMPGTLETYERLFLVTPFITLIVSLIFFIHGIIILSQHTIGISSGNIHEALLKEYDHSEHCEKLAIFYAIWADKNIELVRSSTRYILFGIGCIFASIGNVGSMFLFY